MTFTGLVMIFFSATNFSNQQMPSIPPSSQTSVTQMQPVSARSSNGNNDDVSEDDDEETETETETETESEEEIRPQAAAKQSWAQ